MYTHHIGFELLDPRVIYDCDINWSNQSRVLRKCLSSLDNDYIQLFNKVHSHCKALFNLWFLLIMFPT